MPAFEEKGGGSSFEDNDYNPSSANEPRVERTKEVLALVLKASMDTILEEQAARTTRIASMLFDDVPGIFPSYLNSFRIILPDSI